MARPVEIYRCNEGHAFEKDGRTYTVTKGSLVRAGHPVMAGREALYEPVVLDYDLEEEPEQDREIRSPSGRTQGARSR